MDICTTTRGRIPSAVRAFGKGVHSMLEKPMARTWTEAERAVQTFESNPKVFCQYNDDNMYEPKYRILHDLLQQGVIGKVQSLWLIRGSGLDATSVLKSQANGLENGGGCQGRPDSELQELESLYDSRPKQDLLGTGVFLL